ncbi:MAG TPA: transporter substrate-binding domain-containing protein [Clostridia bacterium]|nr:transporter substrate-binding domain-containing protein [Clostridia bacterium]
MKLKQIIFFFIITLIIVGPSYASEGQFNAEEKNYIQENIDRTYTIGIFPMSGKDCFSYEEKTYGYIMEVVDVLKNETGMEFDLIIYSSWDTVYSRFINGEIDILFGANKTEKREEIILFTEPLEKIPYAIFVHKDSDLLTIGDFENQTIGFQKSDMIIGAFKEAFNNLSYNEEIYPSKFSGFYALSTQGIDGLITPGGNMVYEFIYDFENIKLLTQLDSITSDMTLATLKENRILMNIIKKVLDKSTSKKRIEKAKEAATLTFNKKLLRLTEEEKVYLDGNEKIRVGILKDYLPFELYKDGELLGVAGTIFNYISVLIDLEAEVIVDDFNGLYTKALANEIDVLILAKTNEREKYFDFPRPFYNERDVIYGKESSQNIHSVYELEDQRVAVINGYWHEDYLRNNLINSNILFTKNIQESLELLSKGEVDYIIENRLVAEYYINRYGYSDVLEKGVTTRSSALYFAVTKANSPLASIIDKSLKLIDLNKLTNEGIQSVPHTDSVQVQKQRSLIVLLIVALVALIYLLFRVFNNLVDQKSESKILKEKQKLLYRDSLTGIKNRHYFDKRLSDLKNKEKLCFVIIDLNDLKAINDSYGHLLGDELIKLASIKIKEIFKGFEHIRFGGDEFLLISENKSEETLEKLINESIAGANDATIVFEDIRLEGFSFGIGYAIRKSLDESINDVFKRADEAMYSNKVNGKDT